MIKIHKILWAMRPIISCTGSLMHPICVWTDSNFQQVTAGMSAYFKDSKVVKEELTTIYLPPGTVSPMVDVMSMYTNIKIHPTLDQISQYFNGNKKNTNI